MSKQLYIKIFGKKYKMNWLGIANTLIIPIGVVLGEVCWSGELFTIGFKSLFWRCLKVVIVVKMFFWIIELIADFYEIGENDD